MKQYEYRTTNDPTIDKLDEYGRDGWKLVGIVRTSMGSNSYYLVKETDSLHDKVDKLAKALEELQKTCSLTFIRSGATIE